MNKSAFLVMFALFLSLLSLDGQEAFSRGFGGRGGGMGGMRGGGGWGGGFGGEFRGGGATFRSPSMGMQGRVYDSGAGRVYSRPQRIASPETRPARAPEFRPQRFEGTGPQRPTDTQLQQFLNLPRHEGGGFSDLGKIGVGAAAGALGYAGARELMGSHRPEIGDRLGAGERPGVRDRPGVGDRPGFGDRPSTLPARPRADQIRENFQQRHDHPFTPRWWRDHPQMAWAYWDRFGKYNYGWHHWWRPATWAALAGWIAGASWGSPTYYDYGQSIYYEGDQVYSGGQPVATGEEYYQQASAIATAAPPAAQPQEEDLLPLGVFALSQGDSTDSNMILQLAVTKEGVITGMYYNTTTDTARPVQGAVDKKTQRAAWAFADGKNTDVVMETGIYNLTQDQTEALVHFGKDRTQTWLMVRLQQPPTQQQAGQQSQGF